MSKIHITLVGGQPAPVYNGIIASNPDKVIYIYSNDSKSIVERVKSIVKIDSEDIGTLDPTSPAVIYDAAIRLAEKFKKDDITLNISGGLKSWTYLFGKVFGNMDNCNVIYIDQNNILWNYSTMSGTKLATGYDMHTMFKLYGNPIESNYTKLTDYTKADKAEREKIEGIRLRFPKEFNDLTTVLTREQNHMITQQNKGEFRTASGKIRWEKPNIVDVTIEKKTRKCNYHIESPNAVAMVFNSGWFEYKVADLLSKWEKAKGIYLNCKFIFRQGIDKNEVDIIVDTGGKILFVECKTQIHNSTDIDKFSSVVKNYGGIGSKALFVTDAPMRDLDKQKCEEHDIIPFSLNEPHLGMDNDKALSMLLDSQIDNINIK